MEVNFTPEQEAELAEIAKTTGIDAEQLVKDATLRLLDEERRFIEAVRLGEEALERGEYLTHEEVGRRLEKFLRS